MTIYAYPFSNFYLHRMQTSESNQSTLPYQTRQVFGFPVAVSTVDTIGQFLSEKAQVTDSPFLVAAADVHVITRGVHEAEFGQVLENMDLICPDGMPIVWKLNRGQAPDAPIASRVSGPDLMLNMVERAASSPELKHFLLGGDEEMLATLTQKLGEKFPGFVPVGVYSPPFRDWTDEDYAEMREKIATSGANVVWVGLGCPKQERWMSDQRHLLPPAVYLGVGAAFAFHAGTVKRAPLWMQKNGLEWLYRLYKEPGRLFRRYLTHNSLFLWYLFRGK